MVLLVQRYAQQCASCEAQAAVQDEDAQNDAPPGTAAAEEPVAVAPSTPVATEPQKKLPKALLARLRQRGVLKEGASTAANGGSASSSTGSTAAGGSGLPPGWQKAVDPTYNHPYWFNVSTGERRWTPPDAARGGVAATSASKAPAASLGNGSQTAAVAADAPLLSGWKAAVDAATGVTYYYNVKLNTQQWERPQPAGAAASGDEAGGASVQVGEDQGAFVASESFSGAKVGYAFKNGEQGIGYYRCLPLYCAQHWYLCKPQGTATRSNVFHEHENILFT